jgi:hypothetical protein
MVNSGVEIESNLTLSHLVPQLGVTLVDTEYISNQHI